MSFEKREGFQNTNEEGDDYDIESEIEDRIEVLRTYSAGAREKADKLEEELWEVEDLEGLLRRVEYYINKQEEHLNNKKRFPGTVDNYDEIFLEGDDNNLEAGFDKIAKEIVGEKFKELEIGRGLSAAVFTSSNYPEYCFKVITDPDEYRKGNSVEQEIQFLSITKDISLDVKIPQPYYCFMSQENHFYVMDKLDAVDLKDLILEKEEVPDSFDFDSFFEKVSLFVEKMNEKKIYHRDLHEGNIMIDRKTGSPCVIDFGKSKKDVPYEDAFTEKHPRYDEIFAPDKERIKQTKQNFKNFLDNKKRR